MRKQLRFFFFFIDLKSISDKKCTFSVVYVQHTTVCAMNYGFDFKTKQKLYNLHSSRTEKIINHESVWRMFFFLMFFFNKIIVTNKFQKKNMINVFFSHTLKLNAFDSVERVHNHSAHEEEKPCNYLLHMTKNHLD